MRDGLVEKFKGFAPICSTSYGLRDGLVERVKVKVRVQDRGSGLGSGLGLGLGFTLMVRVQAGLMFIVRV